MGPLGSANKGDPDDFDFTVRGADNRKLCSLYLSLMNRMGVPAERFGDPTTSGVRSQESGVRSQAATLFVKCASCLIPDP
jgi:hypothetical protein